MPKHALFKWRRWGFPSQNSLAQKRISTVLTKFCACNWTTHWIFRKNKHWLISPTDWPRWLKKTIEGSSLLELHCPSYSNSVLVYVKSTRGALKKPRKPYHAYMMGANSAFKDFDHFQQARSTSAWGPSGWRNIVQFVQENSQPISPIPTFCGSRCMRALHLNA